MVYYSRYYISWPHHAIHQPGPDEIRHLLQQVHSIAVVGLSPNPARPSFRVAQGLQGFGYRIIPVRPMVIEVLGEKAFPDLESLPELPRYCGCVSRGGTCSCHRGKLHQTRHQRIWLQDGVINEEAAQRANAGRHHRGHGSLHVARRGELGARAMNVKT